MSTSNPVLNDACDVCIPVELSRGLNRKSAVLPSLRMHENGMYTSFVRVILSHGMQLLILATFKNKSTIL